VDAVRGGDDLTEALVKTRLFPEDFINILQVAEESGRLTEVMQQQAGFYQEEAGRRMTFLTHVATWGVWLTVGILIIYCIFRIALTYISLLDPDNPMYH
jgi:type II secretory pathway component PulF